jgi:hypothetical protein
MRRQADAVPGRYDEIPIDNHLAPGHIHATFPVLAGPSALSFAPWQEVKRAGKGRCSCRSPGGTYIRPHINDLNLESRSVDEWQSADERNSREKTSRARQAAEDLFKRARPDADPEPARPEPNGGAPNEQETRRQPRIFAVPPRLPPNLKVEPPVAAQPMRQRAPAKQPSRTVPPSQIGRVRTLATYGMTPVQVADLYGVTVAEIDRILKSPAYAGKTR